MKKNLFNILKAILIAGLILLLKCIIIIGIFVGILFALFKRPLIEPGTEDKCGENLEWDLSQNGILTISGQGEMYVFNEYSKNFLSKEVRVSPWAKYEITAVVIEDGVLNIESYAFNRCGNLRSVTIADSVKVINSYAFNECDNLDYVIIPDSVNEIEDYAFCDCGSFTIYGNDGSYAQKYAEENGIPFLTENLT